MFARFRTLVVSATVMAAAFLPTLAHAAGDAASGAGQIAIGAGVAIGFAAFGCGIGQGLAAYGALQGIARNPSASGKIFTPMIIGLALIESLVIYALVIGFMLTEKVDMVGPATTAAGEAETAVDIADQKAQATYQAELEAEREAKANKVKGPSAE